MTTVGRSFYAKVDRPPRQERSRIAHAGSIVASTLSPVKSSTTTSGNKHSSMSLRHAIITVLISFVLTLGTMGTGLALRSWVRAKGEHFNISLHRYSERDCGISRGDIDEYEIGQAVVVAESTQTKGKLLPHIDYGAKS